MDPEFQKDHQKAKERRTQEKEKESPKEISGRKVSQKEKASPPKERRVSSMKRQRSGTLKSRGGRMTMIGGVQMDGRNPE